LGLGQGVGSRTNGNPTPKHKSQPFFFIKIIRKVASFGPLIIKIFLWHKIEVDWLVVFHLKCVGAKVKGLGQNYALISSLIN